MVLWLRENLATIIIGAALLTAVGLILVRMIRRRKKGGCSSCGCGCADCPMAKGKH